MAKWWKIAVLVSLVAMVSQVTMQYGFDRSAVVELLKDLSRRLGIWAIPTYVAVHTLTLALCLPYAVVFEAAAPVLFGFLPAVLCVFSAKILGASLSFWIGRLVFRSSSSAMEWVQRNKYFHTLLRGVEHDGWKFVLLARFSPIPSYVINYALAATNVGFLVDFLLPTVIGCLPMILQNTSIGSLASVTVASAAGKPKSEVGAYLFPLLGLVSSILISLRIKKYSAGITLVDSSPGSSDHSSSVDSPQTSSASSEAHGPKKST